MATQNDKRYDKHWHVVVADLASILQSGGYGSVLQEAIKKRRLDGKVLWISLGCAGCGPFVASADNLAMKHLEQLPTQPSIACPRCGSDAGHIYQGLHTS